MHRDPHPWFQEAKELIKNPEMPREMTKESIKATETPHEPPKAKMEEAKEPAGELAQEHHRPNRTPSR